MERTLNSPLPRTIAVILAAIALALGITCLTGCGGSQAGYSITDGSVDVNGSTLTVSLNCEDAENFEWTEVAEGDGIEFEGMEHQDNNGTGQDVFVFKGTGQGDQSITFTYGPKEADDSTMEKLEVKMSTVTDGSGNFTSTQTTASDGSTGSTQG